MMAVESIQGNALAILELKQVSRGILILDSMVKNAGVQVVSSGPACPGKYLAIIRGRVDTVKAALDLADGLGRGFLFDRTFMGNVHPDVFPAIAGLAAKPAKGQSIGIVETFSASAAVLGADAAAKAADIHLVDIRLSRGMGGRAFLLFSGSMGACEAARDAAVNLIAHEGLLVDSSVLGAPHPELLAMI